MQKCRSVFLYFLAGQFVLKLYQSGIQVIASIPNIFDFLQQPPLYTWFIVLCRKPQAHMCLSLLEIVYIGGAFPVFQRFNILQQCAASHQAEIELANLAAFIPTLPWARSSTESWVSSFSFKGHKSILLGGWCKSIHSFLLNATRQPQVGDTEWLRTRYLMRLGWFCSLNTTKLNMSLNMSLRNG